MAYSTGGTSGDYLEFPDDDALDVSSADFSVAFWLKIDSAPGNGDRLFSKGNVSGGTGGGVRYELLYSGGLWVFVVDDNSTATNHVVADTTLGLIGTGWNHFICRKSSRIDFIINGTNLGGNTTNSTTGSLDTSLSLVIGAGRSSGDTIDSEMLIDGIDDFCIFKRRVDPTPMNTLAAGIGGGHEFRAGDAAIPLLGDLQNWHAVAGSENGTVSAVAGPPQLQPASA